MMLTTFVIISKSFRFGISPTNFFQIDENKFGPVDFLSHKIKEGRGNVRDSYTATVTCQDAYGNEIPSLVRVPISIRPV